MNHFAIRRILLIPAFKFGCLVGAVVLIPPGIVLGFLAQVVTRLFLSWLQGWQSWSYDPPGLPPVGFDLVSLLGLEGVTASMQNLDSRGWLLGMAVTAAVVIGGGMVSGLLTALAALTYNLLAALSGGLVVRAEPLPPSPPGLTPQALPQPASQPAWSPPLARPTAHAQLVSMNSQSSRWPLSGTVTRIGSRADNQIVLPGLALAHAEIRFDGSRYVLYDLSNGQTWVNNRPVAGANLLKHEFRVRLGSHELMFVQH